MTRNTQEDFKRFFRSTIWEDLQEFIISLIEDERTNLENLSTQAPDTNLIGTIGGRLEQLRAILDWPVSVPEHVKQLEEAQQLIQQEAEMKQKEEEDANRD